MTFTTDMTLERETKGAVRYAEDQSDPLYLLGTLYLRGELGEYFRRRADGEFTFQTFTDGEKPDPDPLRRIRHGCLE